MHRSARYFAHCEHYSTMCNAPKNMIIVLFLHRIWVCKPRKEVFFLKKMQKFESLCSSCEQLPYAHHSICTIKNYKFYSGAEAVDDSAEELLSIVGEPLSLRNRPFSKIYFVHKFFVSKHKLIKFPRKNLYN